MTFGSIEFPVDHHRRVGTTLPILAPPGLPCQGYARRAPRRTVGLMATTTPPAAVSGGPDSGRFLPVLGQLASGETSGLLRLLGGAGGSGGVKRGARGPGADPQQSCEKGDRG